MRKLRENHETCRFHHGKRVGLPHGLRKVLLDSFFEICQKILQFIGSQRICRTGFDIGMVQSSSLPKTFFLHLFPLTGISGLCGKRGNTRIFWMLTSWPIKNSVIYTDFLFCNGRNSAIYRVLMCGPAPWCVVWWGQRENLDVVTAPLFTRLCHFSHPRALGFANLFLALASTWPP